jgi:hypothetical protein
MGEINAERFVERWLTYFCLPLTWPERLGFRTRRSENVSKSDQRQARDGGEIKEGGSAPELDSLNDD